MTKPKKTLSLTSGNYTAIEFTFEAVADGFNIKQGDKYLIGTGIIRQRKAQTGTRFGRCSGTALDIHGGCQWRNRHDERIGNGRRTGIQLPRHLYDVRKQRIEPVPAPLCTSIPTAKDSASSRKTELTNDRRAGNAAGDSYPFRMTMQTHLLRQWLRLAVAADAYFSPPAATATAMRRQPVWSRANWNGRRSSAARSQAARRPLRCA